MHDIPVTLKWNKRQFSMSIILGETSHSFKQRVEVETGVPISRQKILAKKGAWKGTLKDDIVLDDSMIKTKNALILTLIGSADVLKEPDKKIAFIEDMTTEELQAVEDEKAQVAMESAEGMIQALQCPPHLRDDGKTEVIAFNRHGLSQKDIENHLKHGQGSNNHELQGKVAMSLGVELRRAYVNDVDVLYDGTLISALDDGHIHFWRHGVQVQDVLHASGINGGVESVVAMQHTPASPIAFASAGRGIIYLWSVDGDVIGSLPGSVRGTSPSSIVAVFGGNRQLDAQTEEEKEDCSIICLATRFEVIHRSNPSQFRLPPQNDQERQRRAQAEAEEHALQQSLERASKSIQIWYSIQPGKSSKHSAHFRIKIIEPPREFSDQANRFNSLISYSFSGSRYLIAGDDEGGIRVWKVQLSSNKQDLDVVHHGYYVICPSLGSSCTIVCMEALAKGQLAVSTDSCAGSVGSTSIPSNTINVEKPRAVYVLDFTSTFLSSNVVPTVQASIVGHSKDAVICISEMPNGDLLTGGGKMDATLQLWSHKQLYEYAHMTDNEERLNYKVVSEPTRLLDKVGYSFALVVLPDSKEESNYYGVAAARYNTVKIII